MTPISLFYFFHSSRSVTENRMSSSRTHVHYWILISTVFILSACASNSRPVLFMVNTPSPVQAYVDANSSQSTAVAAIATAQFYSGQLTATVEARNQIATEQAWSIQSTQQAANNQATERAWNATSTADSIQSTAIASSTASAAAAQAAWTQRAVDVTATADSASVQAYSTAMYGESKSVELAIEREAMMNNVQAAAPWAMIGILFIVAIVFVLRWTRVRVIQRDPRGDAPLLLDVVDGVTYDADRHPTSTGGLQREDIKLLPKFSASDHTQTTTHDQMVDLATRGLPVTNKRQANNKQFKEENLSGDKLVGDGTMPKIETIDANSARPLFKDVIPHIVQDSIDAEIILQEEGL
jgi:hypothetical protein